MVKVADGCEPAVGERQDFQLRLVGIDRVIGGIHIPGTELQCVLEILTAQIAPYLADKPALMLELDQCLWCLPVQVLRHRIANFPAATKRIRFALETRQFRLQRGIDRLP